MKYPRNETYTGDLVPYSKRIRIYTGDLISPPNKAHKHTIIISLIAGNLVSYCTQCGEILDEKKSNIFN